MMSSTMFLVFVAWSLIGVYCWFEWYRKNPGPVTGKRLFRSFLIGGPVIWFYAFIILFLSGSKSE